MENNKHNQREDSPIEEEVRGHRSQLTVIDEFMGEPVDDGNDCAEQESEEAIKIGVVQDCVKLNVRKAPSPDAEVVCEIPKLTEVMICESTSTDDFYQVCTDSSIEGFCMKKYIAVRQ